MHSYEFKTASEALPVLCAEVLNGDEVGSRNGRTMELSPVSLTLTEPWKREILVPTRKASLPAQIAETMWVLSGRDDVEWLSHYMPRAGDYSDDGKVWRGAYGPRIRKWWEGRVDQTPYRHDQLNRVVELLKMDPLSRRAVISIFDPTIDHAPGKDIPCNNWLHFVNRLGKLDLHVAIRSNDLMWGWSGINAFEWSVLQEIVAHMLGVQVGRLHFSISSLHLYDKHWNRAEVLSQCVPLEHTRERPSYAPRTRTLKEFDQLCARWFEVEAAIRSGANAQHIIREFPEPMLQAWLNVLAYHWSGDEDFLTTVGIDLRTAAKWSPADRTLPIDHFGKADGTADRLQATPFVRYVNNLHEEKHKAYGDSWKRRGEMLGIMANIARKIDRLGYSGAGDTATDTAIDLLVYLAKYRWWLYEFAQAPSPVGVQWDRPTDEAMPVAVLLSKMQSQSAGFINDELERVITDRFNQLEHWCAEKRVDRWKEVDVLIGLAYLLANRLWQKDQNATRSWNPEMPV